MFVDFSELKSLSITINECNQLTGILANGLNGEISSFLGKRLDQVFENDVYELIEKLAVESLVIQEKVNSRISKTIGNLLREFSIEVTHSNVLSISIQEVEAELNSKYDKKREILCSIYTRINSEDYDEKYLTKILEEIKDELRISDIFLMINESIRGNDFFSNFEAMMYEFKRFDVDGLSIEFCKWYETLNLDVDLVIKDDICTLSNNIKEEFDKKNIKSFIISSLGCDGPSKGSICFSKNNPYKWLDIDISLIKAISLLVNLKVKNDNTECKVKHETNKVKMVLNHMNEGIILTDGQGNIESSNEVASKILELNVTPDNDIKLADMIKCYSYESGKERIDPISKVILERKSIYWGDPFKIKLKNGKQKVIDCSVDFIVDKKNKLDNIIMIFGDLAIKKNMKREIEYLSKYDKITGLYNRNFMESSFSIYNFQANYPLAVIMGDLNGLKLTNDAYGYHKGDLLLKEAGQIINELSKGHGISSRWGGDEFLIVLPRFSECDAKKLCKKIKEQFGQSKENLSAHNISLGYAIKNSIETTMDEVIIEAENYMYKHKLMESKSLRSSIINSIQQTLHEKSYETTAHASRMCELSKLLALKLGLLDEELDNLELSVIFHDIGKITVGNEILNKPEKLNEDEWKVMKGHCLSGYRILKSIPELSHISEFVLSHHERWDGEGYPNGVASTSIPIISRIISVADAYDAMRNDRVYRKALSKDEAINEIIRCSGSQFDPNVVEAFKSVIFEYEY